MGARIDIDFEWPVAERYEIVPHKKSKGTSLLSAASTGPSLKAVGPTKTRRPLEWGEVYVWVAARPPTIEAYAEFAHRFGLLGGNLDPPGQSYLTTWQETIEGLSILKSWSEKVQAGTLFKDLGSEALQVGSRIDVLVKPRADGTPLLSFQPTSLRSALMLQCTQAVISGAEIRDCQQCGQWFAAGGEGGKRADAQFCSQDCRIKFKNDRNRARAKGITK
jgi:hypothetical protein